MKISRIIILGFAIAIGSMASISAFSIYAGITSSSGFTEYRELARDTNLSGRLQTNMLMVRMNVKDFLITNSERDIQQYSEYLEQMNIFLERSRTEIQNPKRAEQIRFIDKSVKEYTKAFEKVEEFITARNKAVIKLDDFGTAMRKDLTSIMDSAFADGDSAASYYAGKIQEHLMLSRYYALSYLRTSSQEDETRAFTEITTEVDKFLTDAERNIEDPDRKELLNSFIKSRDTYIETLQAIAFNVKERDNTVMNFLDRIGPEIAEAAEEVNLSVKNDQDTLGPKLQSQNETTKIITIIVSILGVGLSIFFSWFIRRKVMTPLGGEPADMGKMAELISEGRLDMELNSDNATGLYASMIKMVRNLTKIAENIRGSSESVASGSLELSSATEQLSVTMEDQANQVGAIASAMEEMASSSVNVLENLHMIIEKSNSAKTKADEGKIKLSETNNSIESIRISAGELSGTIDNLSASSNQISEILVVINDIADQTNLLALNAAIEAARAGDAGRGFAVVADEVRKLAERTQSAISEVESIIQSLQSEAGAASRNMHNAENEVEKGVQALQSTVEVFNSIVDAVEEVVNANNLISSSVSEQNSAIDNVNDSIQAVSSGLEESSGAVREITITIEDLSRQAEQMNETVEVFKTR